MNMLAPGLVVLSTLMFQLPATPPMKMGLWETTSNMSMKMPNMPNMPSGMGNHTTTVRSCMTPESYAKSLAQQNQQRDCQVSNQNFTGNGYSADITCTRGNAKGHIKMEWGGDAGHGTVHIDMDAGGNPMSMDTTMTMHYLGADCGSVKPDSPQIMH